MLDGGEGQVGVTLVATGTIEMLASAQHVTVANTHAMGCELLVSNVSTIIATADCANKKQAHGPMSRSRRILVLNI